MKQATGKKKQKMAARITTLMLALVMIFGVVFINNKDESVEADSQYESGVISITDFPDISISQEYIDSGAVVSGDACKTLTLYYYSDVAEDVTPSFNYGTGAFNITVPEGKKVVYQYKDTDNNPVNIQGEAPDLTAASLDVYVIDNNIDDTSALADTNKYLTIELKTYGKNDLSFGEVDISYDTAAKTAKVTATSIPQSFSGDSVIDIDELSSSASYYQGTIKYGISTKSDGTEVSWSDTDAIQIGNNISAEYYGYVGICPYGKDTPEVYTCSAAYCMCDNVAPTILEVKLVEVTTEGDVEVETSKYTSLLHTKTYAIVVTANENGSLVSGENDLVSQGDPGPENYTYRYEIPTSDENAGKTYDYSLQVKDSYNNISAINSSLKIKYLSADISIINTKLDALGESQYTDITTGNIYYSKAGNPVLRFEISSEPAVSEYQLQKKTGDGWIASTSNISQQNGTYSVSLKRPEVDESTTYKIYVKNETGKDDEFEFTICYDSAAPVIKGNPSIDSPETDGYTTQKSYNISVDFDEPMSGINTGMYNVYYTVDDGDANYIVTNGHKSVDYVTITNNNITITTPQDDSFRGKTVKYYASAGDMAGNVMEAEEIAALTYVQDTISVSVDFEIDNAYTRDDNWSVGTGVAAVLTNASTYEVVVRIESDVNIDTATIKLYDNKSHTAQALNPYTTNDIKQESKNADGKYITVARFEITAVISEQLKYSAEAENNNGVTGKGEASLLCVDITKPDLKPDENQMTSDSNVGEWYRNLYICFVTGDNKTEDDEYSSGFAKFEVSQNNKGFTEEEGITQNNNNYILKVEHSASAAGTPISVRATDKAGNEATWTGTYKVDNVAPTVKLTATAKTGVNQTEGGTISSGTTSVVGNPVIDATANHYDADGNDDKLYGTAVFTITYADETGSTPVTVYSSENDDSVAYDSTYNVKKEIAQEKKLTEYLDQDMIVDDLPKDGQYTVTIKATDNINVDADTVTEALTLKVDNTKPVKSAVNVYRITDGMPETTPMAEGEKATTQNAYRIEFDITDNYLGVNWADCKISYTISGEEPVILSQGAAYSYDAATGKVVISVPADPDNDKGFLGNSVIYDISVQDMVGNELTGQLTTMSYYSDNIDIELSSAFSSAVRPMEDGGVLTKNDTFTLTATVGSDVQINEASVLLTEKDGKAFNESHTASVKAKSDGTYETVIKFTISGYYSTDLNFNVYVENNNGVSGNKDEKTIYADLDAPVIDEPKILTDSLAQEAWRRELELSFDLSDIKVITAENDYASKLASVRVIQENTETGDADLENVVTTINADEYNISFEVLASADNNGTRVRLELTDIAGNITYWPARTGDSVVGWKTYFVDDTAPVSYLGVTAGLHTASDETALTNNETVVGNPKITASVSQSANGTEADNCYGYASLSIVYNGDVANPVYQTPAGTSEIYNVAMSLTDYLGGAQGMIVNGLPKDGTYTVTLSAGDNAAAIADRSISFVVDNTAPDITAISLRNVNGDFDKTPDTINECEASAICFDGEGDNELTIRFSVSDVNSVSAIDRITIKVNGTEQTFNSDTAEITVPASVSNEGTPVQVTVVDVKGNYNTYPEWHFLVDDKAPAIDLSVKDSRWENNDSRLNGDPVIYSADEDNIFVNARSMVIEKPDGSTVTITDAGRLGDKLLSELIGGYPYDGRYTVTVSVQDRAGHGDAVSLSFVLDNTIPVNEMRISNALPAKIDKYNNTAYSGEVYGQYYAENVSVELKVTDANVCDLTVTDNGNVITPEWTYSAGIYTATVTVMPEGVHTIRMTSVDDADNQGEAREVTFIIDKTSPAVTTTLNGANYTNSTGIVDLTTDASVNVSISDANKDTEDLTQTIVRTIPGQHSTTTSQKVGEGTTVFDVEADYEVSYQAVDRAGNASEVRRVSFRVDKTAPQLTITGVSDGGSSQGNVTLTFGIAEAFYWDMPAGEINVYKAIDGQSETLIDTIQFVPASADDTLSQTFTEDGEYRFEFTARDRAGNSSTMGYTFILDQNAPLIELSGVRNYDITDVAVTLSILITEDFYSSNTVTVTGTRQYMDAGRIKTEELEFASHDVNSARVSTIMETFEEDGIYDITIVSVDRAGNRDEKTIHFTIDATAPEIRDLSEFNGTVISSFDWDYTYDDLVYDLTVCDIKIYMDGVEYDGSTELADGAHTLRVEATDENGNYSELEYTFTLDTTAPAILINGIEDGDRINESTEITVRLELDTDTLDSVTLNGVEQTVTNNVATFTVSTDGNYTLIATAHDEAGNVSSVEISFEYGSGLNIILIIIICVALILALVLFLIFLKRRKKDDRNV